MVHLRVILADLVALSRLNWMIKWVVTRRGRGLIVFRLIGIAQRVEPVFSQLVPHAACDVKYAFVVYGFAGEAMDNGCLP